MFVVVCCPLLSLSRRDEATAVGMIEGVFLLDSMGRYVNVRKLKAGCLYGEKTEKREVEGEMEKKETIERGQFSQFIFPDGERSGCSSCSSLLLFGFSLLHAFF